LSSSPLDEQYTCYGFAYVENNPVKAKMVENATDYKYSSAMCHAGLVNNSLVYLFLKFYHAERQP
jgi:hypothetical protein